MPVPVKQSPIKAPVRKSTGGVLDRINSMEFDEDEGIKVLLYGQSGTGKTTLWATFPGPILSIICSGGFKPGELRSVNTKEYRDKIKTVTLHESGELKTILDHVKESGEYRTVVLDHVSGFADLVLKEILGLDEIPAHKSWGTAAQQQYGQQTQQCKEYLRALLNLDCNVVIVGQERTFGGRDDGVDPDLIRPTVGVALTPSLAGWLYPACDYVVQTFKKPKTIKVTTKIAGKDHVTEQRDKGVVYCLRTGAHDVFTTKFRVPKDSELPDDIEDPTYNRLIEVIRA